MKSILLFIGASVVLATSGCVVADRDHDHYDHHERDFHHDDHPEVHEHSDIIVRPPEVIVR